MKDNNIKFNIDIEGRDFNVYDVIYVYREHGTIKKLYGFLRNLYNWSNSPNKIYTFTELRKKHKINSHVGTVLKKLNLVDDEFKMYNLPTNGDAIILAIELRDKFRNYKGKP